ncbi:cryptococcal mannosyltransferase 1-domain-containing protein [Aspergillus egyptiacus]|nr:cryptococcal mannosyltransferase 1-domain-containing protein [Aspergillus egyptiacus]
MHVYNACKSYIYGLSFLIFSAIRHVLRYPKLRRVLQIALITFLLWSTADVILVHRHYNTEQAHIDYKPPERQRIFIASAFWNNEQILSRQWNEAVVDLANVFGSDNIFVSVYEDGSSEETKASLRNLEKALDKNGVQRSITISDSPIPAGIDTHLSKKELKSISHISGLRNKPLKPLYDLRDAGTMFDRVLFLSDAVFTSQDVLSLLDTNYGTYAAACSFDILTASSHDTFALRDSDGHERLMQKWPFFRSSRSREAMKLMLPVPVRSCWDSMVFMRADSFYGNPPLKFREVPDSLASARVSGSECCLIHADNFHSRRKGVYLNPFVRVGRNTATTDSETQSSHQWLSSWEILTSLWENRLRRWFTFPSLERWSLNRRYAAWKAQDENNKEQGDFCLIDELWPVTT